MSGESAFTREMYERIREGCQRSASAVVPIVNDLVHPKSVLDVGGGEGWWARAFMECGVERALVLDESGPAPDATPVVHDGVEFAYFDAVRHAHCPLEEQFDLAICLETAEHIPEDTADNLIEFITMAAPVVLFSAAIPGQTGHGHVNCQWPAYWSERFARHSYSVSGDLRRRIWNDERIEPWYRQNLLIAAPAMSPLWDWLLLPDAAPLAVVHPDIWAWRL